MEVSLQGTHIVLIIIKDHLLMCDFMFAYNLSRGFLHTTCPLTLIDTRRKLPSNKYAALSVWKPHTIQPRE